MVGNRGRYKGTRGEKITKIQSRGLGSNYFLSFMVPCNEYAVKKFSLNYYFWNEFDFLLLKNCG